MQRAVERRLNTVESGLMAFGTVPRQISLFPAAFGIIVRVPETGVGFFRAVKELSFG